MANYYRVDPNYWKADRRHWSDREKLLGLYLLTCPHRNLEGLYWLPKAYIAADLGWQARAVDEALRHLIDAGFAAYDEDAEVVFVLKSLEYQAPRSPQQITGAITSLARVPTSPLFDVFLTACDTHAPTLAKRLRHGMPVSIDTESNVYRDGPDTGGDTESNVYRDGPDTGGDTESIPARTRSSSSNSSSTSPPNPPRGERPTPPQGDRKRDLETYLADLQAWAPHLNGDVDPDVAALWVAGQARLTEALAEDQLELLSTLHPHRLDGETLVLGGAAQKIGWVQERFGSLIVSALHGRPVDLVPCEEAS